MSRFLIALVLSVAVAAGAIWWATTHPTPLSGAAVTIAAGAGIAAIAVAAFRWLWSPILAAYPPREPAPDAVRRRFQSFGLGIVNMGLSIHVAADGEYLHLTPLPLWRLLGARSASIPWSAMEPVGRSGRVVRVDGHRLDGPRWCMSLAFPNDAE